MLSLAFSQYFSWKAI